MTGIYALMVNLLYGTGMRLVECTSLRIKDVDFTRWEIMVRFGKGDKDRVNTMLPMTLIPALTEQIAAAKEMYEADQAAMRPGVILPDALELNYDIRPVQELLGHADVSTTVIYLHALNKGGRGVISPIDVNYF